MFVVVALVALILLLIRVCCKLTIGRCTSPVCLVGKTALITGGNSGIGFQTALALAGRGCRVIIADKDNCENSREKIIQETGNKNVVIKQFDLASLRSVRELAHNINQTEERLDILINNAGTAGLGNGYTEDDLHIGMQVNHFGSFLLTHLLVELLKKSAPSRIIFVSSIAAFTNNLTTNNLNWPRGLPATTFSEFLVYANSKLCNLMSANEFARKLRNFKVTCNSLHPGIVYTPIYKNYAYRVGSHKLQQKLLYFLIHYILKLVGKNSQEGAQTTIHLALAKELEKVTGKYFVDCKPFTMPALAKNRNFSAHVWEGSEKYVKLSPEEKL